MNLKNITQNHTPFNEQEEKDNIKDFALYQKAKEFSKKAHGDQKYGVHPYFQHLQNLNNLIDKFCDILPKEFILKLKTTAYLHDVIEDTKHDRDFLEKEFNKEIANIVFVVTNESSKKVPYEKIKKSEIAVYLKMIDRISNMEQCLLNDSFNRHKQKYILQYPDFKKYLFSSDHPKELWNCLDELYKKSLG